MQSLKDPKLLKRVAERIKEIRKENGITQVEFYSRTRIHIARIETGKTNISIVTLNAICLFFGISLKEFFRTL